MNEKKSDKEITYTTNQTEPISVDTSGQLHPVPQPAVVAGAFLLIILGAGIIMIGVHFLIKQFLQGTVTAVGSQQLGVSHLVSLPGSVSTVIIGHGGDSDAL